MGYALIVGGGVDGRYTISLDIGEAERAALVARFDVLLADAQANLAASQAVVNEKTAELDAASLAYGAATEEYIQLLRGDIVAGTPEELKRIINGHAEAQREFIAARTAHASALSNKNALSFSADRLQKALTGWQTQVLTETRPAWCADLTEDAAGYVATMEIPGESELILIAPGGRLPVLATDGYLRSRGLMAPWQAFANAAILPGWQKFKPTYRWGTVTVLNVEADTATIVLANAVSSAQNLSVNQTQTLTNVPVVYMECNAEAFEVGDNVVVEFQGRDWAAPRVIGFLDNPRPCVDFPQVEVQMLLNTTITGGGETRMFATQPPEDTPCGITFASTYQKTVGEAAAILTGPMSCTGNVHAAFQAPRFTFVSPLATIDYVLPAPYFVGATNRTKCISSEPLRPASGASPERYFGIISGGIGAEFTRAFADATLPIYMLSLDPEDPCPIDGYLTAPAYTEAAPTVSTLFTNASVVGWLPAIPTMSVTVTLGSTSATKEYELKTVTHQFKFIYGPVEE